MIILTKKKKTKIYISDYGTKKKYFFQIIFCRIKILFRSKIGRNICDDENEADGWFWYPQGVGRDNLFCRIILLQARFSVFLFFFNIIQCYYKDCVIQAF